MQKRMQCCGCAPLAVDVIYAKLEDLERRGLVCPYLSVSTRERLSRIQRQLGKQPALEEDAALCE